MKKNQYVLKLKSTNLSQDGGNQVTEIKENDGGFSIKTSFPQGTDEYTYFIKYENNDFIVKKVIHELSSWQEDGNKVKVCEFRPQVNMQKSTDEIFRKLIDGEKKAECVTKKNLIIMS